MPQIRVVSLAGEIVLGPIDGPVQVSELLNQLALLASGQKLACTPALQWGEARLSPADVLGDTGGCAASGEGDKDITLTLLWRSLVSRLAITAERLGEGFQHMNEKLTSLELERPDIREHARGQEKACVDLLDTETRVKAELLYLKESERYILYHALPIARWYELFQVVSESAAGSEEATAAVHAHLADARGGGISFGSLRRQLRGAGLECTDQEVLRMMTVADQDGDRRVSLSELEEVLGKFTEVVNHVRLED